MSTKWMDKVDSLHGCLRVLRWYMMDGPRAALTGRQMKRASRLLALQGEKGIWTPERMDTDVRLQMAGINPETMEVADEVRWAHAVDYMRATETFRLEEFKQWLLDHDEPSCVPARDVPARPHPRARKKVTESTVDRQINERIRNKLA